MNWVDRGLCWTQPERMFAEGAAQNEAKALCNPCPVRLDCLAHALDHRERYGVWGAMTERERQKLLRRRPAVTSWAAVFKAAGTKHETEPSAPSSGLPAEWHTSREPACAANTFTK
ncbi:MULTISPECIES: WhiB family transcriptional regulator [Streptomyces]|uniref:WhiB family transcriptional regulator n=1 Tax=Streptomyces TaxID=1883 RepID=UPI0023DD4E76|nr:WhiB family transcriptional regulator [Streptomyces sp. FXJ1.172]WEP00807.1 WhiB family transcriptional regulator [Streptomyces sp. FXJ1.172]